MKINPDKVPVNLDDAVSILKAELLPGDIKEFKNKHFCPSHMHFGFGMMLRNEWSLWDTDSQLVRWFKAKYGIDHADDISSMILDCLYRDVLKKPRQTEALAATYIAHWKKMKK